MQKRCIVVLSLSIVAGLLAANLAPAQDIITNADEFTAAFNQTGLSYPSASPYDGVFQPMDT